MNPYLRKIELNIFPDFDKRTDITPAWQAISGGRDSDLRITFNISVHCMAVSSPSSITVYNLSEDTRQFLASQKKGWMQLKVGYANTAMYELFQGSLTAVLSHRDGPNIITTLYCSNATEEARLFLLGTGQSSNKIKWVSQQNYDDTTNNKPGYIYQWIKSLVSVIPGVEFDENYVNTRLSEEKDENRLERGYSTSGTSAIFILNELAFRYQFSWTIVNGKFFMCDDSLGLPAFIEVSQANGLLKRAEPGLIYKMFMESNLRSMNISCMLLPQLKPNIGIKLVSKYNTRYNKTYKVYSFTHTGDSHSPTWDTNVEAMVLAIDPKMWANQ